MKKIKKLYVGIDYFKFLAALGIMAIHTNVPLLKIFGRLGVPFFVIVSSYFFFNHYFEIEDKKSYLLKYIKRLGFLYLSWQLIYLPLLFYHFKYSMKIWGGLSVRNFFYFLYTLIYPGITNNNGWGQSWFLIAMMIGMPLFLFLHNKVKSVILFLICLIIEIYYILANEFQFITHLPDWGTLYFPRVMIYIFVGLFFYQKRNIIFKLKMNKLLVIFLVTLILFLLENIVIRRVGGISNSEEVFTTVPTSFVATLFAFNWTPKRIGNIIFRNFSTFLYCIHYGILEIMEMTNFNHHSYIRFTVALLISVVIFGLFEQIKNKYNVKFLKYMI